MNEIAVAEPSSVINEITNGEADLSSVSNTSPTKSATSPFKRTINTRGSIRVAQIPIQNTIWKPSPEWVQSWRAKLPLQTIMRCLQVLVPQVEKICIDK